MFTRSALTAAAFVAVVAAATPGAASWNGGNGGGKGDYGETYYSDLQRNPQLIEPGMQGRRYLEYWGGQGWDRRQAAWYGYPAYRPNVRVRPYGAYGYGYGY